MQFKQLFVDRDAVSPVIGVILMVAITVILAAVIGTFVLGLGDQVQDNAPQASFTFDLDQHGADSDELTVTHDGGDSISASQVNASVSGAQDDAGTAADYGGDLFGSSGDVTAGNSADIDNTTFYESGTQMSTQTGDDDDLDLSEATVRVTWAASNGDSTATLGRWDGPDS